MSSHYHVATGLAGYGPDASDTDGFPSFETLSEALSYARDELASFVDFAHETAHSFASSGDFEAAWLEIVRMESLETLRANLSAIRRSAPLYYGKPAAYAALEADQADAFPHDVSHNTRLYLWTCDETECDSDD